MVHLLSEKNSIINLFIAELRNVDVQKDRMRFRRNLERIGEIAAIEISKTLPYKQEEVTTPLGIANVSVPAEFPVVGTILRAGLPLHQGLLNYFDHADNAFAAAYRRHHKGGEYEIEVDYLSSPSLEGRVLIIVDPMLATGSSIEVVYKKLLGRGTPKRIHVAAAIAAEVGVKHVRSKLPENTMIWVGALDKELTAQSYIVPGLGDAGDLAFGRKD